MRAWSMIFFPRTGSITKNIRNQIFSDKKKQQTILKIHNPKMKKTLFCGYNIEIHIIQTWWGGIPKSFFFI